jgi:hypothetical protein
MGRHEICIAMFIFKIYHGAFLRMTPVCTVKVYALVDHIYCLTDTYFSCASHKKHRVVILLKIWFGDVLFVAPVCLLDLGARPG